MAAMCYQQLRVCEAKDGIGLRQQSTISEQLQSVPEVRHSDADAPVDKLIFLNLS